MLADSVNRLRGVNRQIGALHCADERAFSKSGRREGGGTTGGHRQAGSLPGKRQAASQDFPTGSFNPHALLREPPVHLGSPAPTGGSIDRRLSNSNGRVGTQRSMVGVEAREGRSVPFWVCFFGHFGSRSSRAPGAWILAVLAKPCIVPCYV